MRQVTHLEDIYLVLLNTLLVMWTYTIQAVYMKLNAKDPGISEAQITQTELDLTYKVVFFCTNNFFFHYLSPLNIF